MERTLTLPRNASATVPKTEPAVAMPEADLTELKERLLITLYHKSDRPKHVRVGGTLYKVIGDDEGTDIAVKAGTGEVYSVDESGTLPVKFINSNEQTFHTFLRFYLSYCPALKDADDEKAVKIVGRMRREFYRLDRQAVREGTYWSSILEQVEAGLL